MRKNGIFLFVISRLVPEIFKIFVLCKLGTDDVRRCVNREFKITTTATAMATGKSLNKRFNEQNNGSARAL